MAPVSHLGRIAHEARRVLRAETTTHRHLRERLAAAAVLTVVVDLVATIAIYLLERDAPGTDITSIGSAAFWTTSQLLTISSALQNPISTPAQIIDLGLELYAITVVAAIGGSFAAFFHRRSMERAPLEAQRGAGSG